METLQERGKCGCAVCLKKCRANTVLSAPAKLGSQVSVCASPAVTSQRALHLAAAGLVAIVQVCRRRLPTTHRLCVSCIENPSIWMTAGFLVHVREHETLPQDLHLGTASHSWRRNYIGPDPLCRHVLCRCRIDVRVTSMQCPCRVTHCLLSALACNFNMTFAFVSLALALSPIRESETPRDCLLDGNCFRGSA